MGWPARKLSDICTDIFAGGDVPKAKMSKHRTKEFGIPIFSNGEKNKGLYGYTDTARVFEPAITVSARGTIGYSEIRCEPFLPVVRLIVLVPNPKHIELKYLKYVLKGMDFVNSGASIPQLTVPMIREYQCVLPSLPEQKRIVVILDQAFADIDKARTLTEQNLKNARELFKSSLQQVFSQCRKGWPDSTLGEIAENLDKKRVPITKKDRVKGGYPYYGASGIVDYVNDFIFDEELLLVSEDGANLLARTYPIAFTAHGKYWVNNHAHVLKFANSSMQKFTEYYLNSISLEPYVSGMAQPKLNQKSLHSIPVPKVNSKEAEKIVTEISQLQSYLDRVKANYTDKLNYLDELKKSLLQKAFSGELTQDFTDAAAA